MARGLGRSRTRRDEDEDEDGIDPPAGGLVSDDDGAATRKVRRARARPNRSRAAVCPAQRLLPGVIAARMHTQESCP